MATNWCTKLAIAYKRCPNDFQDHLSNFKVTHDKNHRLWPKIWALPDCNFGFNSLMAYELMHKAWCRIEVVPYCFPRSSITFQDHTRQKIADFDPNRAFPDCYSCFNSPMALKWYAKLYVVWKRCPIFFQDLPSNFKAKQDKKLPILTRIERFQTVTPVSIHWWIWNDAQRLM